MAPKNIYLVEMTLTKSMYIQFTDNWKILLREIKYIIGERNHVHKWENSILISLSKLIYGFNKISIKSQGFFGGNLQADSKCTKEYKGPRVAKTIWKMYKVAVLLIPDFKNYLQSYSNQDHFILVQGYQIYGQWNREGCPEIDTYMWSIDFFYKRIK